MSLAEKVLGDSFYFFCLNFIEDSVFIQAPLVKEEVSYIQKTFVKI